MIIFNSLVATPTFNIYISNIAISDRSDIGILEVRYSYIGGMILCHISDMISDVGYNFGELEAEVAFCPIWHPIIDMHQYMTHRITYPVTYTCSLPLQHILHWVALAVVCHSPLVIISSLLGFES